MQDEPDSRWAQPFTFAGAAQLAHASQARLFKFQLAVALLAALAVVVFFETACVPVINRTIALLPSSGAIQRGTLHWASPTPVRASGSSFLWISVDPRQVLEASEGPDLQVELGETELRLRSLFGYWAVPYPRAFVIAVNRTDLEPWWGAWHPAIAAGLGAGVMASLFATWAVLALIYAWPIRLIAFYADRQVTWRGSWRIALASLLPGAVFMTIAFVAYTFHHLNLVQLLAATVLHLMVGWVYVLLAPFCLPHDRPTRRAPARNTPSKLRKPRGSNPFSSG
jgi:hypothetical protein